MIDRIDRDNVEMKKCYDHRHGMKFKSFKDGVVAGIADAKNKKEMKAKERCPYLIPQDVLELLKKRARWFAGYEHGWQKIQVRIAKKKKK